jgi:glycosyltransferase involved in cell wall biosynthesis
MVTPVFPPRNTAGVFRTLRFCRYLPEFGWIPSVCTMNADNPKDSQPCTFGLDPRVEIFRIGERTSVAFGDTKPDNTVVPSVSGSKRGIVSNLRAFLRPYREYLFETPDKNIGWAKLVQRRGIELLDATRAELVYSSGPPHSTHLAAMGLSKIQGLPWIADFRDPWARLPWVVDRNPFGQSFIPKLERSVIENASLVVLNNESSESDFRDAYPEYIHKFRCIPNGIDPVIRDSIEVLVERTGKTSPHRRPVICHAGNLYGHRDPRPFLQALAELRRKEIQVRFKQIGTVDSTFDAIDYSRSLGLEDCVEFVPAVRHEQALEHLAASDILLIIQPDASVMVPAKLFEMMAFRKPILGICDSPSTEKIIEEYGGWTSASRDVEKIQIAVQGSIAQLGDAADLDRRARVCEQFDGVRLTGVLAGLMDQLKSARGSES